MFIPDGIKLGGEFLLEVHLAPKLILDYDNLFERFIFLLLLVSVSSNHNPRSHMVERMTSNSLT